MNNIFTNHNTPSPKSINIFLITNVLPPPDFHCNQLAFKWRLLK